MRVNDNKKLNICYGTKDLFFWGLILSAYNDKLGMFYTFNYDGVLTRNIMFCSK